MKRLNNSSLAGLPDQVAKPAYDRGNVGIGIVHIGPGAFHRAHQAHFTERALEHGGNWGICGVSMHSASVKNALAEQDGLYTLAIQERDDRFQVIGALKELLHLEQDRDTVMHRLKDPDTKVVTLTITEKGYCLGGNGQLDLDNDTIKADLSSPQTPQTAIGLLALAIDERRASDTSPFLVISCDNVTENGRKLRDAVIAFAKASNNSALVQHLRQDLYFPSTMVDSITPATDDSLRNKIAEQLGYEDAWPIKREAFAQWVIEETPFTDLPAWEQSGVTFTDDIEGYENAKLRLLNLPHSCLTYFGRLLELDTVYEAISHAGLAQYVRQLVDQEVIPSCVAPKGLDLNQYRDDILARFHNPSIKHRLEQIAHDGSQKLQMRLMPILQLNLEQGLPIDRLCTVLAAWFNFIIKKTQSNQELVDPMHAALTEVAKQLNGTPEDDIQAFLSIDSLFETSLRSNRTFVATLERQYRKIQDRGVASVLD